MAFPFSLLFVSGGISMKTKIYAVLALLCVLCLALAGCGSKEAAPAATEAPKAEGEPFAEDVEDKDFSALRTPGSQEAAYEYKAFFRPAVDGINQPYVGDTMPYYEDGTYYIYYLKEGGDSYNHSIYLATTKDFVTYTEYDEITPPAEIGQKRDFRDPQAYYDAATDTITLTVTASQGGVARILKYTLSGDLSNVTYDGVIFTNAVGSFWNLECSDTFKLGDKYYLTYSAQDDTLWYAMSDTPYGPYGEAKRLDGKLFYAAKHVESPDGAFMVGWARRSESPSSTSEVSGWAGNLAVQKIVQKENGDLALAPVENIANQYSKRRHLAVEEDQLTVQAGSRYNYTEAFTAYESFLLKGKFTYTGKGCFGLAFDYSGQAGKYKLITLDPTAQKLQLQFNEGSTLITETDVQLEAGKEYAFTYLQEGSVGMFWLEDASLTVRLYGVSGKPIRLYAENNVVSFTDLREYTK